MHRAGAARVRTHGAAAQSDGRTAATLGSRKKARALDEPALLLLA
ncbi:hypothetical protein X963_5628 [Burkholderia pseudomallei MSHR7498]|nr:hypothetical protein BMAFMH_A0025 [Burkholderia mallei FMH]EDK57579.1 hypothetical protein BMAJHU_D0024 [Burkholderia mallei JHU]EDO91573.1 hypothetical protein BURPSPAST_Z0822 [Burkholderia pseudomallei Pasteur 52237]KGC57342.1 hypothetical protein DM75_2785 [Burkholderia mallei]KGS16931.1 hypothetical protein X989_5666 [Burkholderia pseudomallei MSHR4378]KGS91895.1 hypothetical protein X963_5628 [Burkholderia pseudomallei MSHR7498]